jgi:2-polyprenyl-3-methyl-5-hydroxy-6-metoxy-1,4-benzoquinol methylase
MNRDYFRHVRTDITPLLPAAAMRVLDVGSGAGRTLAWLRSRYPGCSTVALEGDPANLDELRQNADETHIVDLNGAIPDVGAPDLLLFLDVLEHLVQPDDVLRRLTERMAAGGTVIVSCPNIAHRSVSVPLLLRGRFEYQDAGILDRTHLRFFVRDSAVALMNQAGLTVQRGVRVGLLGPRTRLLDRATFGILRDQLTSQYVMAGTRAAPGTKQGAVQWLAG